MTLTQITKIRGPGIHTTSNIVSHNINSSGIITAVAFKGPFTGSSNIQSGILTATKIDLNGDIDVDGHTNLDNVSIAGVTTTAGLLDINAGGRANTFKVEDLTDNRVVIAGSGGELESSTILTDNGSTLAVTGGITATTGTFSGNVSIGGTLTYEDVTNIDSVGIVTVREGIFLPDSKTIKLGNTAASPDFTIEHNGSNAVIDTNTGDLILRSDADDIKILSEDDIVLRDNDDSTNFIHCINGAGVKLYNAGNEKLETTNTGVTVTGNVTATTFIGALTGTASQVTIANGADNRVLTAASANTLNGEANLTFDGTTLQVENSGSGLRNLLRLKNSNASAGVSGLYFNSTTSGSAFDAACVRNGVNGSGQGRLYLQTNNGSGLVNGLEIEYDGQVTLPTNSLNILDSIVHIGDTDTKIRFPAADTITFETASDEALRIDSNQRVMIGSTASGGWKFRVQVPANASYQSAVNITNNTNADLNFEIKNSESRFGPSTNTPLAFKNGGGERLRIASDGKVLVGDGSAITPSRHLDVRGTGNQGILVGSTDNNGAQLLLDGIGGGDGSGGNYGAIEVPTSGHLTIRNHDADKNIILGTGSASGANDTVTIDSNQMMTIATRNSSSGGDLGFKFGSFGIRTQDVGGYNYWHIDRNYGGWQSNMISLKADGKVGINQAVPTYQLHVNGSFAATTKSFVIDHPTKENHKLRYACLEGPENSVYVRGRSSDSIIELPDYWVGLVHNDSITVNVTPIGNKNVWVESINNNSVTIGSDDSTEYFYTVFAERKDVEKLEVEVEK